MKVVSAGLKTALDFSLVFARRVIVCTGLLAFGAGVAQCQAIQDTSQGVGFLEAQEAIAKAWLDNLYTPGVTIKGDSVYFDDETRIITSDSSYRKIIYPETYSWTMVQALMQRKAIKPAVWHLINLYQMDTTNRKMVLQMILPLDQVLEMDRVMTATYYTYIAFDPDVYTIVNGKTTEVKRPDIAEQKLIATKAITDYILADRLGRNASKKE